ncbi:uncharacterized protein NPIL_412191 [Nephila pilipes]|uniref:Uncharacterized protein n=1 Tax=Nephila pilipes TaxID=299642 RepID=A0A8X6P3G9_NEPPI|nr:uncharacterized protein NPIL_412191 [Nephila pilipes]
MGWKKNFLETGSIVDKKRSGRPCTSYVNVKRVREGFLLCCRRSVRSVATKFNIPISTVCIVIKKRLRLHAYKVQIVQALELNDRSRRMMAFATNMLRSIKDDAGFFNRIMFFEICFHFSGIANCHKLRNWGSETPDKYHELQRDSPKVNVQCGLTDDSVIKPFF